MDIKVIYMVALITLIVIIYTVTEYHREKDFQSDCHRAYQEIYDALWNAQYLPNLNVIIRRWDTEEDENSTVISTAHRQIVIGSYVHQCKRDTADCLYELKGVRMQGDHYVYCKGLKL